MHELLDSIQPLADQISTICHANPRSLGNVIQRPAKPNLYMPHKIEIQPKAGIEQNEIQHKLKHNLVVLSSFEYTSKLDIQNPEPHCVQVVKHKQKKTTKKI